MNEPRSQVGEGEVADERARRTLFAGAVLITLALVATFVGLQVRSEQLADEQVLVQAQTFAEEVISTRAYVAGHGGIYVPEKDGTTLNPYLEEIPGIRLRIEDEDGNTYVLQNPAVVTRGVAEELSHSRGAEVAFGLRSLMPLNPDNAADAFETRALEHMRETREEVYAYEDRGDRVIFRYVRPLVTTSDCMGCHEYEGYTEGAVDGALAIEIDATETRAAVRRSRFYVALALVGTLAALLVSLFFIVTRLLRRLRSARDRLYDMAVSDELTGLDNRRMAMAKLDAEIGRADRGGQPVAVAIFDLDRFKDVNDGYGHAVGDEVLRCTADALSSEARTYDTVARIGGEEFLIVVPGVDVDDAQAIMGRMRERVSVLEVDAEGSAVGVTISAGVAMHTPGSGEDRESLLRRADAALYQAKQAGRDRLYVA
jgi:diguanylate cyclase (GGDEF)-like protein